MIVIVDNYDSFVFNLARYFREIGEAVTVVRNDAVGLDGIAAMEPRAIVLSPGPCGPAEAGLSMPVLAAFSGRVPLLGVCLGHQCVGQAFGGRVGRAREPLHGRASAVEHDGAGLFAGLPNPLTVGRYHSLIVEVEPDGPLRVTARSGLGEVMAVQHRALPVFGVQFHPESILTEGGHAILSNFLRAAGAGR